MAAMKVQGGRMVPVNNLIRNTPEANELNRLLIELVSILGRAGASHAKLKSKAAHSPEFMQALRQAELNIDTALSNIESAQRAINKPI